MSRFTLVFRLLVAFITIGIGGIAHGQDAPRDAPQQPAPPSADAQTAIQPAQDADTANEIQQLRSALDQLQQQVARLTSAVEELQADRIASIKAAPPTRTKVKTASAAKKGPVTPVPSAATAPETDDKVPLTLLVFQDGHRIEARNYAIVGQTLWIYTEEDSKKVPLADLDVAATKNANSDRGITFQVPPATK